MVFFTHLDGIHKERHYGIARVYYRRRGFKQSVRFSRKLNKRAHDYKPGGVHDRESMCRGKEKRDPERGITGALLELAEQRREEVIYS